MSAEPGLDAAKVTAPSPRTTVIMAAYKAADTIERSVQSVLAQTDSDLELIVVIDGSPDDTHAVLMRMLVANPDERVHVINLNQNGGVSRARNVALEQARGQWLAFLDADDEFAPTFLSDALAEVSEDIDVVQVGHYAVSAAGKREDRSPKSGLTRTGVEGARDVLTSRLSSYLWDKVVRRSVVERHALRFSPELRMAEDTAFMVPVLAQARQVRVISKPLVNYTVSADSTTWTYRYTVETVDAIMSALNRGIEVVGQKSALQDALEGKYLALLLDVANASSRLEKTKRRNELRRAAKRVTAAQLLRAARYSPVFVAGGILMKISPTAYSAMYRKYANNRYEL